ncbi:MAG: agmatinase [Proteobacteria bacterium]|nr:agmatinase [Pseudomonadota bacterium]
MIHAHARNFLGLDPKDADYARARVAVLPIPYEATVSYGGGTARGPAAIIEASAQVELYDEELRCEPFDVGVATLDPVDVSGAHPSELFDRIAPAVTKIVRDGKIPLSLGGEHSITPAVFAAVHRIHPDTTVVQLDAHADLRQEYGGERMSHACAIARVKDLAPAVQVGIRNLSRDEALWVERDRLPVFFAHKMRADRSWMAKALDAIKTEKVYITIDVDAFDSSVLPMTGTPEPGGMGWYDVTDFLRLVMGAKRTVGMDIVELAPREGFHAADFLVAKLAYKCLGYLREGPRG